jgi:hypothetical protein
VVASVRREEARERLENFATGDLTRYLRAVDSTLYAAAAGAVRTRVLVRGLRAHHELLAAEIERLGRIDDAESFAATAHALVGLLNACLHLEREVLAPEPTDLAGLDVAGLVADLNTLLADGMIEPPELVDVRAIRRAGNAIHASSQPFPARSRWVVRTDHKSRFQAPAPRVRGHLPWLLPLGLPRNRA